MVVDLIEECFARGWSDGLPVVPPTRERVERMLGARADRRDEVVATLPPSMGMATLEKVAANAVMAGCTPDLLPVVEAAVRAVAAPEFNLDRVLTTASSQTPVVLVNGPRAAACGYSGGWEALGSKSRANATTGRALMLVLRNVASHAVGGLDHATLGHPGKYSFCITENTELSPWPTWHLDEGLEADADWVSVFPSEAPLCMTDMGREDPDSIVRTLSESMAIPATYNAYFRQDLWLVLSPQHATIFADAGWSRRDVAKAIHEGASLPAERLRGRGLYGYIDEMLPPVWLDAGDPVPITDSAERIKVLVSGGEFGGYSAALFGEGETVTTRIASEEEIR
jgi:hypothetical protein